MKSKTENILNVLLASLISLIAIGCTDDRDEEAAEETSNSSEFLTGVDGWTIEGDAEGGTGVIPNFSEINGVGNSGYIYAKDDVAGGVWYFVAPSKYHGDKTIFFDGKVEFYLIQDSSMQDQFFADDLLIEGVAGERIALRFDSYPKENWTKYQFFLSSKSQWRDESDNIASNNKIKRVLSSVSKIMIRGEFEDGPDTGGLDGFQLIEDNSSKY